MIKPHLLLRLATVVSSVLLVAAFISYRAGAFDGLLGTSATGATLMGGSKSYILNEPGALQETPADSVGLDPAFMGGSKSIIFVEPPAVKTAGGQVAPPSPASRP
jgi:hypothetical protein